jgi:hypothetical protein
MPPKPSAYFPRSVALCLRLKTTQAAPNGRLMLWQKVRMRGGACLFEGDVAVNGVFVFVCVCLCSWSGSVCAFSWFAAKGTHSCCVNAAAGSQFPPGFSEFQVGNTNA